MHAAGAPAFLVALLALLLASPAGALDVAEARRMLHVRAGATCLRADDLAAEIPRWLEDDVLATDVQVWVEGSYADARVVLVRLLRDGQELARRAFQPGPEGCAQLRSAVSLAIALALHASVAEPAAPAHSARTPTSVGPLDVVAGGTLAVGLLPRVLAGPELRLQLGLGRHFMLRAAGTSLLGRDVPLRGAELRFDAFITGARADACARVPLQRALAAHLCAGGVGGVLRTRSERADAGHRAVLGWAAFSSAVGLTVSSAHWLISAEPGLVVPLRRVRVGVVDSDGDVVTAQRIGPVALSVGLGAGYRF